MKTLKFMLVFAIAAFTAGSVSATGNLKVNMNGMDDARTYLAVSDVFLKQFEISLRDNDGRLVYFKRTKLPATSYVSAFNFSELRNGYYTLTVKTDKDLNQSRILASDGVVKIIKEKRSIQPFFSYAQDMLKLTYLNFTGEEMAVHVFNGEGLVFQKVLGKDFSVTRGFDLSELSAGKYRVVFTHGEDIFEYAVAK